MSSLAHQDLVEIYAASSQIEAQRLVMLLEEDGVEAMARATTMSSFPTSSQHLILVREEQRAAAKKTIEDARREGAVSDTGEWL